MFSQHITSLAKPSVLWGPHPLVVWVAISSVSCEKYWHVYKYAETIDSSHSSCHANDGRSLHFTISCPIHILETLNTQKLSNHPPQLHTCFIYPPSYWSLNSDLFNSTSTDVRLWHGHFVSLWSIWPSCDIILIDSWDMIKDIIPHKRILLVQMLGTTSMIRINNLFKKKRENPCQRNNLSIAHVSGTSCYVFLAVLIAVFKNNIVEHRESCWPTVSWCDHGPQWQSPMAGHLLWWSLDKDI